MSVRKIKPRRDTAAGDRQVIFSSAQIYRRKRKREQEYLDRRAARLAGPVTVTRIEDVRPVTEVAPRRKD